MRYAKGQEETLKNCTQRRVKAGHLPKKCSDTYRRLLGTKDRKEM